MDVGDVINGWRIVEDAGAGRSGHVFIVCREGDPDRLFALKMQRTDRPDVAPDANAREAEILRTGMRKSPRVMPALVDAGEWRGVPFFVMVFFVMQSHWVCWSQHLQWQIILGHIQKI